MLAIHNYYQLIKILSHLPGFVIFHPSLCFKANQGVFFLTKNDVTLK